MVKPPRSIPSAAVLATLALAVEVAGDQTARLTIGGYMPPRQRVLAVQPTAAAADAGRIRLDIQSNSPQAFTVAADWTDIQTGGRRAAGVRAERRGVEAPNNNPRTVFTAANPGLNSRLATTRLEIEPPPANAARYLQVTIASK